MSIPVVTVQTLERVDIVLNESLLVGAIYKIVLIQGIWLLILAKTKDGINITIWLEGRVPNASTIRINLVWIDELLVIHADCRVYVAIAKAPRIFNLVTRPLEANAPELFRHAQVGESVRIWRLVERCGP